MARLPVCRSAKARAYRAATHSLQLADSNYKKQCFGTAFLLSGFWAYRTFRGYRTFCVDFNTDEARHCLVSSVFYLFPKKIKGGQNELVKSPKMIAMTALIRVISF